MVFTLCRSILAVCRKEGQTSSWELLTPDVTYSCRLHTSKPESNSSCWCSCFLSIVLSHREDAIPVQYWSASVEAGWHMHLVHNELFHSILDTHCVEKMVLFKTKTNGDYCKEFSVFLLVDENGLPQSLLESVTQTKKLRLEIMIEVVKKLCKVAKMLKWKNRRDK